MASDPHAEAAALAPLDALRGHPELADLVRARYALAASRDLDPAAAAYLWRLVAAHEFEERSKLEYGVPPDPQEQPDEWLEVSEGGYWRKALPTAP